MKLIRSIFVALFVLFAQVAPVSAATVCSDGMIANTYGLTGQTVLPDGTYCGIAGVMTLKADGSAKGRVKQSCGGMTIVSTGEGTYKVKSSCMATADIDFDDGTSGTFHFVVVEGGKTLFFVGDQEPGFTFTGLGKQL